MICEWCYFVLTGGFCDFKLFSFENCNKLEWV